MKAKKLIAITLCMIFLFSFIPHTAFDTDYSVQPLDFYIEETVN